MNQKKEDRIVTLAKERFDDLSSDEEYMFQQIAVGKIAVLGKEGEEKKKIRAECINWLCTNNAAKELVTHKGVYIFGAEFEGEIDLEFTQIPFPLGLFGCGHSGMMNFQHARIRLLNLMGVKVGGIYADGIDVDGGLFLREGFEAKGEVRLLGARIGGNFDCTKGKFYNEEGYALSCDRMEVEGGVYLRKGFKAEGGVRLLGARIGGDLDCENGKFYNEEGYALSCDGMKVEGSVFLSDEFEAKGNVRLLGARIGGDLECDKGRFDNEKGYALSCDGMEVENVYLRDGFDAKGRVSLCIVEIKGSFQWRKVESSKDTVLDLRDARVGTLRDDEKSWPEKGKLLLDGFTYEKIADDSPKEAKKRLAWLKLQDDERFRPQPYEQLAKVLERGGYETEAKKIRIELAKGLNDQRPAYLKWPYRVFVGHFIGYGYRMRWAFGYVLLFIGLGWFLFGSGYNNGVMRETSGEKEFERFHAFVYSVDVFVPLVDLHQGKYWLPDAFKRTDKTENAAIRFFMGGGFLWWYLRIHIVAGWVLSTLLVVGLTGLVRQRR